MHFAEIRREHTREEITPISDWGTFIVQCKDRRGLPEKPEEGYLGKVTSDLDLQGY